MEEEQRITVCKTSLNRVYEMLKASPQSWRNYLGLARTIMTHLASTSFMQQPNRVQEQVWIIAGLQRLAYMDADNGAVTDIAAWCSRHWLVIYQRDPQNLAALRGLGQAWLSRAQPALARIHRSDGSPTSTTSAGSSQRSIRSGGSSDEQAEKRSGTADYVEARGYLQPATEYFEKAVGSATMQRAVSGALLATACPL